jgi:hypothetical protein
MVGLKVVDSEIGWIKTYLKQNTTSKVMDP